MSYRVEIKGWGSVGCDTPEDVIAVLRHFGWREERRAIRGLPLPISQEDLTLPPGSAAGIVAGIEPRDPVTPHWRITLNDYQITNLRSAIEAINYPYMASRRSPLEVLNTGDWLGELYQMLPLAQIGAPNYGPDALVERAKSWKAP